MQKRRFRNLAAMIAMTPAAFITIVVYIGTMLWTVQISFTNSKIFPVNDYVGFDQYARLFRTSRWTTSLENIVVFGLLFIAGCLILGFLLAVMLDQKIRAEDSFRTIYLYPYAMSFIVTGLAWQWIMNPELGVQKTMHAMGWESFRFDWAVDRDMSIYAVVIAGIWHGSGLVMALMLACFAVAVVK